MYMIYSGDQSLELNFVGHLDKGFMVRKSHIEHM